MDNQQYSGNSTDIVHTLRDPLADSVRYPDGRAGTSENMDSGEAGGLLEYWRIIRRRKGTVILISALAGIVGFLVTLPQTPIYQARTSVEIVGLNDNFLNIKQVNPVTQTGATSETSDIQTQIRIFQSESLNERVLAKIKTQDRTPDTGRISVWRKALNLSASKTDDASAALRYATKSLKVKAAGQTRILEITVDSPDPRIAANFANTLANEFIDQNLESRWKTTEKTTEWLTHQLDDMRIKLERSEDGLQVYARQAGLLFTQEKTNVDEDKLRQVQVMLTGAQADRVSKQSRYEMAVSSPPEALPDVLNDAGLRDYQSKLTDLRRQLAELNTTYTPDHPKVKRIEAQIVSMESALTRERAAILRRIKNEYDEALRKESLHAGVYAEQAHLVSGEGEKAIQYNILKREVDSNRQVYDAMLQQMKQATVAAALRASNVRVLDPAKVPTRPYKPNAPQSGGIGLLAGCFLGVTFIVMRERADRTIQQPGEASFYLNVPELGIIPAAGVDVQKPARLPASRNDGEGSISPEDIVELVTWQHKPSMAAEAFRSALISILFSGQNGSRPRVLVLSSAGPSEGKSTVVSNLGIAIAEVGNRVLLIDADMRKPRLHDIFGLSAAPGLAEMLKGNAAIENGHASAAVRPTDVPNLFLLTSGASTSAAMTLLYGPKMLQLLSQLRQQFDTILIDTPPMLQIPDARVLARVADRAILVIRSGRTTRDAAVAAFQRFREDGTQVLGTILNDWDPKNAPAGYYGYYTGYNKAYYSHYRDTKS